MHMNTSLHFTFWAGILLGLVACWKWPGYKQHPLPRWAFLSCQHVVWVYCADFFPLEGSCLPFHYHFSHWMWVSEFLTLVLNAIVEFIKLNARTVAHFDSVSVHQALRFDIYIHVYFLRNFWSRLCQVGLTWPWECRHQAGLKTYAPARTWRHSTPPAWKEACFRLQAFHPVDHYPVGPVQRAAKNRELWFWKSNSSKEFHDSLKHVVYPPSYIAGSFDSEHDDYWQSDVFFPFCGLRNFVLDFVSIPAFSESNHMLFNKLT